MRRVSALARFLDDSIPIPGTSYRIGYDAIIGLIPGLGDLIGGALSTYIVAQAIEQGISKATVMRMAFNVLVETIVGAVPFLGDLFDAAWKANVRNARLLESALAVQHRRGRKDTLFLVAVVAVLLAVSAAGFVASWWIIVALRDAFSS